MLLDDAASRLLCCPFMKRDHWFLGSHTVFCGHPEMVLHSRSVLWKFRAVALEPRKQAKAGDMERASKAKDSQCGTYKQ